MKNHPVSLGLTSHPVPGPGEERRWVRRVPPLHPPNNHRRSQPEGTGALVGKLEPRKTPKNRRTVYTLFSQVVAGHSGCRNHMTPLTTNPTTGSGFQGRKQQGQRDIQRFMLKLLVCPRRRTLQSVAGWDRLQVRWDGLDGLDGFTRSANLRPSFWPKSEPRTLHWRLLFWAPNLSPGSM